ncbi:protein-L-isoaspartate(D-aspartate) O-methyltransferase [Candidatus Foliamicus sp.]
MSRRPSASHRRSGIGLTSARARSRLAEQLQQRGIRSQEVLERIRNVPRHLFIDEALERYAYQDNALPIGAGQTISQPYVVALMTQALLMDDDGHMRRPGKVLEVGSGCGYQTAILAPLVRQLFSIERIRSLVDSASSLLRELDCGNVRLRHGDGMLGWPGQAPFDGILVAAAAVAVPQALLDQLAPGGRMVIPVGAPERQELLRIERHEDGELRESLAPVTFVPLLPGQK